VDAVSASPGLLAAASGLGLGLSLIVAIGAQNAFVLRQGLRGEHVGPVVAVCTVSDWLLIAAGVLGAGAVITRLSWATTALRYVGATVLLAYAIMALRRARRPDALRADAVGDDPPSRRGVIGTCLALTWLNPHVYLDTVVLLGSIAAAHHGHRWAFALGAAVASGLWFSALGGGARLLRPLFARPSAWRVLDLVIAFVVLLSAAYLVAGA
jgi:L-lysine exporter family protein LysE/ArgO